jgi:hypothetical protein
MTLSAEERSRINKENASHARGPVTEAGKNKSKYNALKHGGRAETLVLPNESPDDVRALFDQWDGFYRPRSPAEAASIDKIVLSLQKAERLRRAEHQAIADQVRQAEHRYDEAQEDEVERHAAALKEDPAAAVRALSRSAAGCRWLLEQWEDLGKDLDRYGAWIAPSRRDLATRLRGMRPEAFREDGDVFWLRLSNLFVHEGRNAKAIGWLLEPKQVPDTMRASIAEDFLPDPALSRQWLLDLVADEVADLKEREELLRKTIEEPARAGAAERALVLEGPEGQRLHRYQVTAENDYHRAYNGFLKARAQEAKLAEMAPPAPLPNEPKSSDTLDVKTEEQTTSAETEAAPAEAEGPPAAGPGEPLPNEPKSAPVARAEIGIEESSDLPILPPQAVIDPVILGASVPIG